MQRQKTLYQWDKRHNKYVKRTLGDMQDNNRGAKKVGHTQFIALASRKNMRLQGGNFVP